jgi:hypothetical protein
MADRTALAVSKGRDGVLEPDNVDAYTNGDDTGINLTARWRPVACLQQNVSGRSSQVGHESWYKEDVDQLSDLVDHFDWALLNEQCFQYNECRGYQAFVEQQGSIWRRIRRKCLRFLS